MKNKKVAAVVSILLLFCVTAVSCSRSDFNTRLDSIVKADRFNISRWEIGALTGELKQIFTDKPADISQTDIVIEYFNALQSGKAVTESGESLIGLQNQVQKIIEQQIRQVLREQKIKNPFGNFLGFNFPPLDFLLSKPPNVLIISPREKIEQIRSYTLKQDLNDTQMASIESQAEELGISALVVELGGLGATFPTFVNNDASLKSVINGAAHEWLHQYLAFKPLGFRYVLHLLGISRNYDVETINETVTNMVGDEIAALVYDEYYAAYQTTKAASPSQSSFDYNAEMRNIRQTVDAYLADGQIEQAEQFMEERRQLLLTKGYYIRKLNQAYFAFYGSYADEPTSISPIGTKLKEIRIQSTSIKEFLDTVSQITGTAGLDEKK